MSLSRLAAMMMMLAVMMLAVMMLACADPHDIDGDGFTDDDCDPDRADRFPGAPETPYDSLDQDCNGYDLIDVDGDGAPGALAGGMDCNDFDSTISPYAPEIAYDGKDQDCRYGDLVDLDRDSFAALIAGGDDCDDLDATIHRSALEVADGRDQDCDGVTDETTAVFDDDGDDFSELEGDCNDFRPEIHPGATEVPGNHIDEDCSQGDLVDGDGDGFTGALYGGPDCDDADPAIHPGATEVPDLVDNNCSGAVDEHTVFADDDLDSFSESTGDCNDYNDEIYPGRSEIANNGLDDNCNGTVDEPVLALAPGALASLMAATESGPRSTTPGDVVYRPAGFLAMYVRYVARDPSGAIRDFIDVLARPPLPPRSGLPGAPVHGFSLVDGSYRWIVEGGPVPAGAVAVGQVEIAPPVPFLVPVLAGDQIERSYVGIDLQGNAAILPGATLTVTATPQPLIEETVALLSLAGTGTRTLELPSFEPGDVLMFTNQEQAESTEDDWAYDCIPVARLGGGIRLDCQSDYDSNNGKTILVRVWRAHAPLKVRCVNASGVASCAVPPTITVQNDQRFSTLIECPIGYRCLTVVTPLGEWTARDRDFGWKAELAAIDPVRDLGAAGVASTAAAGGMPAGYVANVRGDVLEIHARGGNHGSYARFVVSQLLIPVGTPLTATAQTFRSLDRDGMTASHAVCPSGPAIIAPALTTYDPHFDSGPSLLSRLGGVIEQTGNLGQDAFEMTVNPGPAAGINLVKSIVGFVTALFGLGDPHEDDAAVVKIALTPSASDPTCVDLTTEVRFVADDAPPFEHAVTVFRVAAP